ncbi:MAG TPA: FAD-dependent oxidoreductase [Tepidisphaeraceae bacterium]|jgi:thioredoxin reductase (NADPH)|nr:FAD-dependent oxidoreductase [Tepidisphaeraceae bacterium]
MATVTTDSPAAISSVNIVAFPTLDANDLAALRPLATLCDYDDGAMIFRAGDADIDLFIVETGGIEIRNPADDDRHIVTHGPGQFAGDIDLLTRRPVIVNACAAGVSRLLRVPGARLREVLNRVPQLGEKMLIAALERRRLLAQSDALGLRVVGPGACRDTTVVREFLFKNFVPHRWYDTTSDTGRALMARWGSPKKSPVIECSDGQLLLNPPLRELARSAGIWRDCPIDVVDLAIIGGGPAGMTAAVYAASEGVSTVVLDRLGPGGQAAGSSKIENFIGFPSGLSGAELAMRGVLQMLKFGARMVAPINVERLVPATAPGLTHELHLDCGSTLRARTVLLAAGVNWRRLEAQGAARFESAGIHYACTSVEALLYDTQDVAVVGAGNSAGQAAMFLADCCRDRQVHLLVRKRLGPGMSDYLVGRIRTAPNITVHEGVQIDAVHGERRLESVTLRGYHTTDGSRTNIETLDPLPVAAVFVFIGAEPGCAWLPETVARDKLGYVLTGIDALRAGKWPLTDREPCPLETTLPGLLAAGDIRAGSTKRVGFAVGDGSLAVTCVHKLMAMRG